MSTKPLAKARLRKVTQTKGSGKNANTQVEADPKDDVDVQFNPTSLKITQQNNIDTGGVTTGTLRRQNPSAQSATLSFDLEYDTAEEIRGGVPVDVRTKTRVVRQFVEPPNNKGKEPPPLLKFIWGTFSFMGIVNQLTEDIDLFSPEGTPIRAKVSVTVKEVRPEIEAKTSGAGARTSENATKPGESNSTSGAPGTPPPPNPDTAALAQSGESLQQLLARLKADPATWRAAMTDLESPLDLPAGAQVQLPASASAGLGLGVTAGFAAGSEVGGTASLAESLGVSSGIGVSGGIGAGIGVGGGLAVGGGFVAAAGVSAGGGVAVGGVAAAGFALAEGGGVVASSRIVAAAQVEVSVSSARASFEVPAVPVGVSFSAAAGGSVSVTAGASAQAAVGVRVPPVDPRTQTYGQGIPLRARVTLAPG